jgi:uncharacterized protein YjbJ (UPF0337 family)
MNWDVLEGKWKQFRGSMREKWGKFTDDDLDYIAGKRDRFVGKLQERYGHSRDEAERYADEWMRGMEDSRTRTTGSGSDSFVR